MRCCLKEAPPNCAASPETELLNDALLQNDVGVERRLAGGDDGVALLRLVVEAEALHMANLRAGLMLFDDLREFVPDGRLHVVAGNDLHQRYGRVHIGVQREEGQNRVQHLGAAVAVQTDQRAVARDGRVGEVAVADDQRVAVAIDLALNKK